MFVLWKSGVRVFLHSATKFIGNQHVPSPTSAQACMCMCAFTFTSQTCGALQ